MSDQTTAVRPSSLSGCVAALLALVAGIAVYALTREAPPESIYTLQHLLGLSADSVPFALPLSDQLPSFLHMLALMLATNTLTRRHPCQRKTARTVMLICALTMEFIQANSVKNAVSSLSDWNLSLPNAVTEYVQAGTFDTLDVLAILAAALLTSPRLTLSRFRT